jgi:hypothetical protein
MSDLDLERRKFLTQAGAALGGLFASPRAALLGAAFGGAAVASASSEPKSDGAALARRQILRSGEPMNSSGHAFGRATRALAAIELPARARGTRMAVVFAHEDSGASVIEIARDSRGRWDVVIASAINRRHGGAGARSVLATPWGTALLGENGISELDPVGGHSVPKKAPEGIQPVALSLEAAAGRFAIVRGRGLDGRLFKLVSEARYDPRDPYSGRGLLSAGELSEGDNPLTSGAFGNSLEARLPGDRGELLLASNDDEGITRVFVAERPIS